MEIIREGGLTPGGPDTALALGYFDGVHIGHQAVVAAAREAARTHGLRLGVFTFGGMNPAKGKNILSQAQKYAALEALGVDVCFEPAFESFRQLSPEAFFADTLLGAYRARALACGANFGFGAKRAGNTALLQKLCAAAGISLSVPPMATYAGQPVSSSRIRQALAAGDIPLANALLGRPYAIDFPVQHGRQLGTAHGFPTMNQLFPQEMQAPAHGVYITAAVPAGEAALPSATGFGTRPTVGGVGATCETFIPGYSGNLYGKAVEVRFYQKIAETQKFADADALADAVHHWARQAQDYFAANPEATDD